jgi:hypothetical protein
MIGISQRTSPNIAIMRRSGSSLSTVATVPITPKSRRYFMLMEEDYIQMEFSLVSAVHFAIGDFIDDPIFGRFRLSTEQMPKYNAATGGFDYSLKFEADYMCWRNLLHTLTTVSGVATDAVVATTQSGTTYLVASSTDGVFTRKEAKWTLTDSLQVHAQQLLCNLKAVYYGLDYIVAIHSSAAKASEVKCITYDGCSMLEAMNMMASEWECEWWVTRDTAVTVDGVPHSQIIHFGKCELSNTPLEFVLGETVEGMDVSRDQQTYANRIYAYGGTQNIPEDYDRSLVFTIDDITGTGTSLILRDSHRKLTTEMIYDSVDGAGTLIDNVNDEWTLVDSTGLSARVISDTVSPDTYSLDGTLTVTLQTASSVTVQRVAFAVTIGETVLTATESTSSSGASGGRVWTHLFNIGTSCKVTSRGEISIALEASITTSQTYNASDFTIGCVPRLDAIGTEATAARALEIMCNGYTYAAVLNPYHYAKGENMASYIGGIKRGGTTYISSDGVAAGDTFTIPEKWLIPSLVPYSHYTPDYDTGVMSKVGERRLHLGTTNRYVQTSGLNHYSQFVEIAVAFENIFPRLTLKVGAVSTSIKTQETVHDDGSVSRQNWTQYRFTATKADGSAFTFNTKYIMDGNKLRACFTTPSTLGVSGYKLAGMSFDVGFDNDEQVYTIIRNEDYGTVVPNEYLYPTQGDEFFLAGWNPKAITGLGLVASAEAELLTEAEAYLAAITDGQFTIRNTLMSNVLFKYAWGGRGNSTFGLLDAGTKVTVTHAALPGGSKTSRIIGYEYKLDMPYDTPTYVVGETEAFSRLKQIEKQLTKLT